MRKKLVYLILFLFVSFDFVFGKNYKNTKTIKNTHKKTDIKSGNITNGRGKRSLLENNKPFVTHVGYGLANENVIFPKKSTIEEKLRNIGVRDIEIEPPFWGTRGRRDSSSESIEFDGSYDEAYPDIKCKSCGKYFHDFNRNKIKEQIDPFWGDRGRRDSDDLNDFNPFWGNRGRRQDDLPFWGSRGRRNKLQWKYPNEAAFWNTRGRRDDVEPFWGNRGRRDESEPFWGNRGRRDENEPFWGNRGRRETNTKSISSPWENDDKKENNGFMTIKDTNPYWSGTIKFALKENIINAMNKIKYGVENLARMRRVDQNSFWDDLDRQSTSKSLFNELIKNRIQKSRPSEHNTLLDERMYAEQPHYILIERSSRSSAENDPFYISRGKKYFNKKLPKGVRDRRGVLEELVKSVRNDPYYIARGKKAPEYIKIGNSTISKDEFVKAKELICSAIDLLIIKEDGHKIKRETDESERERRTILKKLAAQLQMDPYFVTRGKKDDETEEINIDEMKRLEEFINQISSMCN